MQAGAECAREEECVEFVHRAYVTLIVSRVFMCCYGAWVGRSNPSTLRLDRTRLDRSCSDVSRVGPCSPPPLSRLGFDSS